MTHIQYLMALALRGFMALVGMAVALYYGVQCLGSALMLSQMMPELQATDSAPPLLWLVQHFGINGGLMLVGVGVAWSAIRAIILRIEQGVPSEDEVVGRSPGGRFLNALIYGAGFLWGAFSLAVTVVPGTQKALLLTYGTTVEARVSSFEPTDDPKVWMMHYSFQTPDGRWISDSRETMPSRVAPSIEIAPQVRVSFDPAAPEQHEVTHNFSIAGYAWFAISHIVITAFGLWGLIKNFGGPRLQNRAPARPHPLLEQPLPPLRTVARPSRTSFGRRNT